MFSQNVTNSRKMSGTSSSGVSQTNYARQWTINNNDVAPEIEFDLLIASHSETIGGANDFFLIPAPRSVTTAYVPWTSSSITKNWQRKELPVISRKISEQFYILRQRQDNWDCCGSKKPNKLSLSYAEGIISDLLAIVIEAGYIWLTPSISSDEDGYITIEWHKRKHELHIEVRENEAEYIKVWGANIEHDMHLDFLDKKNYLILWDWLVHG